MSDNEGSWALTRVARSTSAMVVVFHCSGAEWVGQAVAVTAFSLVSMVGDLAVAAGWDAMTADQARSGHAEGIPVPSS